MHDQADAPSRRARWLARLLDASEPEASEPEASEPEASEPAGAAVGAPARQAVEAWLQSLGLSRPGPGADEEDPRVAAWWLLRMAARTHARLREPHPPEPPDVLARFEARLSGRPPRAEEHGQLHVDAPSTLRRARAILERVGPAAPVVAVGDDDAVTVALALLGATEVAAVDIDRRVLAFLREASGGAVTTFEADVIGGSVPHALRRRFSAAVTDPYRDLDGGLGFTTFAAACLRRAPHPGELFWVDDPDWNFEHALVRDSLAQLGLEPLAVRSDLHAYPLDAEAFEAADVAPVLGVDEPSVRALVERTSAWSNLYVLRLR